MKTFTRALASLLNRYRERTHRFDVGFLLYRKQKDEKYLELIELSGKEQSEVISFVIKNYNARNFAYILWTGERILTTI